LLETLKNLGFSLQMKSTLYEGGVKGVALIWSNALRNPGRVSTQLMHMSDWYPTIYAIAGKERLSQTPCLT
jgi:arylsulfatase A-like enzyme